MSTPQNKLAPFRGNARRKRISQESRAYSAGNPVAPAFNISRVGFLEGFFLQFRGTVTLSGAGALTDQGPWNLINRITFRINTGPTDIVSLTGYELYLRNFWFERGFAPDKAGSGDTTPDADIHASPVASGANTWLLSWWIPVAANFGNNFTVGMINMQAEQIDASVEITCGALLDPATLVTATTGNFFLYKHYREVPLPTQVQYPGLWVCRTLSKTIPVTATGDQQNIIERGGLLTSLIVMLRLNNARSNSIDRFEIQINDGDKPEIIDRQWLRALNRKELGCNLPTGVFFHDFWHATEQVSEGDSRDFYDTQRYTKLDFRTVISSGASLGAAGTNNLHYIRSVWQPLAVS